MNKREAFLAAARSQVGKGIYVYVNTSSYGLLPDQDYEYFIVYSS